MGLTMTHDPTIQEMREHLDTTFSDLDTFDREAAIYWFAADYHGGQWSNLYRALSASQYKPGALERDCPETAFDAYQFLTDEFI